MVVLGDTANKSAAVDVDMQRVERSCVFLPRGAVRRLVAGFGDLSWNGVVDETAARPCRMPGGDVIDKIVRCIPFELMDRFEGIDDK